MLLFERNDTGTYKPDARAYRLVFVGVNLIEDHGTNDVKLKNTAALCLGALLVH